MPFTGIWHGTKQYFDGIACPENIQIPLLDITAYPLYPRHRWIYNKLLVCETQGMPCGPHGIMPPAYPVFGKPIYNLLGMGAGGKVITSAQEWDLAPPGHMWMPLLSGEHVSSDAAVIDGEAKWWRHTTGEPLPGGAFDYWTVLAESLPEIETYCGDWLRRNLKGYTGCVNLETIGGKIIEAHLRFADQWVDLYGRGWIESVVDLYSNSRWDYRDESRRTGYSVVLFGPHGPCYRWPKEEAIEEVLRQPSITSVQITFEEEYPPEVHVNPPGGFRLAIINCWDLDAGRLARSLLARAFPEL